MRPGSVLLGLLALHTLSDGLSMDIVTDGPGSWASKFGAIGCVLLFAAVMLAAFSLAMARIAKGTETREPQTCQHRPPTRMRRIAIFLGLSAIAVLAARLFLTVHTHETAGAGSGVWYSAGCPGPSLLDALRTPHLPPSVLHVPQGETPAHDLGWLDAACHHDALGDVKGGTIGGLALASAATAIIAIDRRVARATAPLVRPTPAPGLR